MAKLKASTRNALLSRKGKLSPAMASRIRVKANKILGVKPDPNSAAAATN